MQPDAEIKKNMNYFAFSFMLFVLVPCTISLGRCDTLSFSICWMTRGDAFERSDLWLNATALKSISRRGKFVSLTVPPTVENTLALKHRGDVKNWTFTIIPGSNSIEVRSVERPEQRPSRKTQDALNTLSGEAFACENMTLFLHQDGNLTLAIGYTRRLPIRVESRSTSMMLLSWTENPAGGPDPSGPHKVSLYRPVLDSYVIDTQDTTTLYHYRFTALESCSPYVACLERSGLHALTCLITITDPGIPRNIQVTSWNSSSVAFAWDCPENRRYSLFLLTAFYLDGSGRQLEEVRFWHHRSTLTFSLSDLPPCSRIQLGVQTVCQAGADMRYSKMAKIDGNSEHSSIQDLRQTTFGPNNYTLSWGVRNTSSVSAFRVFHQGALQGSTLDTSYTVAGLQPCSSYQARVEAQCGDGVLMSAKNISANTGPWGVSDLQYRASDSMVLWRAGTPYGQHVAFTYQLSLENGSVVQSGRLTQPTLRLPGLRDGQGYVLDVFEECGGVWSDAALVCFDGVAIPFEPRILSLGSGEELALQLDFSGPPLVLETPWPLTGHLRDNMSEPRVKMEALLKDSLEEILSGAHSPVQVQLVSIEPSDKEGKTKIHFKSSDVLVADGNVNIPVGHELDFIQSREISAMSVQDGLIYWEGPDLCSPTKLNPCPADSLCVNTLLSYACVCKHGYYDIGATMLDKPLLGPVCKEKGLFSKCLERQMSGGISRAYLTSRLGGEVSVKLNNGSCDVEERSGFIFFSVPRKPSPCGTTQRVNKTHIEFRNTLAVFLSGDHTITRYDLKVVWQCMYPRSYVRRAQLNVGLDWFTAMSLVEVNSSLALGLTMALYIDELYASSYRHAVELMPEEFLFFQVELQTNDTFAPDVLLQLESCWATESRDPKDPVQALLLQDGCAVDETFIWLSTNGRGRSSRFSVQMFHMPTELPMYFHCSAHICGPSQDCSLSCHTKRISRRSVMKTEENWRRTAVVSAGPLVVSGGMASRPTSWSNAHMMTSTVGGFIGCLGLTVLAVGAAKSIVAYYERRRLQ